MRRKSVEPLGAVAKRDKNAAAIDATREKLLVAATQVFAENGFYEATVRQISQRARVNIAAVNYHFRDKLGLYTEVLRRVVERVGEDVARRAFNRELPPEEMLRAAIKIWLTNLYRSDGQVLPFQLMRHELLRPTPVLAQVVDGVIRPNYDRLRAIVGALMGLPPDHDTVRLCTHSIMGQVLLYPQSGPVLTRLWPEFRMTPEQLDRIASHIANFSLAYIQSVGARK